MKKLFVILLFVANFCFSQQFSGINTTPQPSYFVIQNMCLTSNPTDGATVYCGVNPAAPTACATECSSTYIFVNSTIISVSYNCVIAAGSAETISAYVNLNNSPTLITSALTWSTTASNFSVTGLSINVPAGTLLRTKFIFPTWVTNPTGVTCGVQYFLRPN